MSHRRVLAPLGDIVTLQRGFDLPTDQRLSGSIPVISSSGRSGAHAKAVVSGPGVVTGRYGTIGKVFYVPEDFWPLNTTLFVRDFKGNDPRFISYLLQTVDFESCSDKSSVPGVNRNHLHAIRVPAIPIVEQREIAAILGALDDKIELNRCMNHTLEAMAQALFQSWFVDFDPVRAKMEGRQPAGMDAETAALFPDLLGESDLGEIPFGWLVRPLPEAFDINPPRSLRSGHGSPYLEMSNVPTSSARVAAWEERGFTSGIRFTNGDTLVARITPCLENGKTAYVDFLQPGEVGWGSTEFIVLRGKDPLPREYAYFLARSASFRTYAIRNMIGTSGRQRVPVASFASYLIPVPDRAIAKRFGVIAGQALTNMKHNDEEAASLKVIRDTLLPRLLSGELRVPEAERLAEAVV